MKKIFVLATFSLFIVGCGSGGGNTYVTEEVATPEVPAPNGTALMVTGNEGNTGITYTNVGEGSVLIDCGDGGCGDVYVASPIEGGEGEASIDGGCDGSTPCDKK